VAAEAKLLRESIENLVKELPSCGKRTIALSPELYLRVLGEKMFPFQMDGFRVNQASKSKGAWRQSLSMQRWRAGGGD